MGYGLVERPLAHLDRIRYFEGVMKIVALVLLFLLGSFFPGHSQSYSPVPVAYQDDWMEPGAQQHVQPLSFDGKEFTSAFNATADRPRLVMVFSPT